MKKHLVFMTLLVLAFSMIFSITASADSSGISSLRAIAFSATQVRISWQGSASVYEVNYSPVDGSFRYAETAYANSIILGLAPDTTYEITVNALGRTESDPVYVTTPRFSTTREYGYKYQNFNLYYVSANSNVDFWDDSSRTRADKIQGSFLASAGHLRNFFYVSDFTLSSARQDKEFDYVVVMIPPRSADRYLSTGTISVPGSWTWVSWAYPINNILELYLENNGYFAPGKYVYAVYLNGWLGGKSTLIVE